MGRKDFVSDLQEAVKLPFCEGVHHLQAGDDDGTLIFYYKAPTGNTAEVAVQVMIQDLSEYPSTHRYMIYTTSDHVPPPISKALDGPSQHDGLRIQPMLAKVVKSLDRAVAGSRHKPEDLDEDHMDVDSPELTGSEVEEDEEDEEDEEGDEESTGAWSPKSPRRIPAYHPRSGQFNSHTIDTAWNARIRDDLRAAKDAGFRVGRLGGLLENSQDFFVTISCRVAKLGISEEALQAWHLDRSHYAILLIRYTAGYRTLERLTAEEAFHMRGTVQMRVGLSKRYKISLLQALNSFSIFKDKDKKDSLAEVEPLDNLTDSGLQRLFIARPLDELLNDRLVILLRYRMALGIPWNGAEEFYNDHQGCNMHGNDTIDDKYSKAEQLGTALPKFVTADHLAETHDTQSFPLLAMQFFLRHLVRCTEFCLVCHTRVEADFEALKPYVCSKPLCLYQYMALGFGPSIEDEILSQPHVVDLLISFCYSSASAGKLQSFPTGMGLTVPDSSLLSGSWLSEPGCMNAPQFEPYMYQRKPVTTAPICKIHKAKFNKQTSDITFEAGEMPVKAGDWLVMVLIDVNETQQHRKVLSTHFQSAHVGPPVKRPTQTLSDTGFHSHLPGEVVGRQPSYTSTSTLTPAATPPPSTQIDTLQLNIQLVTYCQNFDEQSDAEKQRSICTLLASLPSIKEMREYLQKYGDKETTLRSWSDRISPAALGLLRWIISSNRSCIVQVDNIDGQSVSSEERVAGMSQWMQFRFAQGAPDKEQRFIRSVREASNRLELKYPTIFAWHGSPLHNWHGIVREGLHFKDRAHGRAFGDGVYHSLHAQTSLGYSGMSTYRPNTLTGWSGITSWPLSELRITQAISLNEIVNVPSEFVSRSPHLVVAQLDWIQSRYLFVKCGRTLQGIVQDQVPKNVFEQDPAFTPIGSENKTIIIPSSAVSVSRRTSIAVKTGNKKLKMVLDSSRNVEEAYVSEGTDAEDLEIFCSDSEEMKNSPGDTMTITNGKQWSENPEILLETSQTDFVPGKLDRESLPLIEAPSYATPLATKTLQREFLATLKIQRSHAAHELGWYIDQDLIKSVYQWIVELHSFEADLPLAKDLKARNLKSVVLELRFGKDYPISPPFVRVIRPRFKSFMAGGGGHVTAGGALCMELLTNSGWSAVSNIESVLLQVRMAITSTEPFPARLERGGRMDYEVGEAVDAYIRACKTHGWEVPEDFKSFNPSSFF